MNENGVSLLEKGMFWLSENLPTEILGSIYEIVGIGFLGYLAGLGIKHAAIRANMKITKEGIVVDGNDEIQNGAPAIGAVVGVVGAIVLNLY